MSYSNSSSGISPSPLHYASSIPTSDQDPHISSSDAESLLSSKQFRKDLFSQLSRTGVGQSLKAQLRLSLLQKLQSASKLNLATPQSAADTAPTPLLQRILNALIADYLHHQGFLYSLSVFLPESQTSEAEMGGFDRKDILEALRIGREGEGRMNEWLYEVLHRGGLLTSDGSDADPEKENYLAQANRTKQPSQSAVFLSSWHRGSLLSALFESIAVFPTRKITLDTSCQTDSSDYSLHPSSDSLSYKLKAVEDQFLHAQIVERELPFRTMEERMVKYQRELQQRMRSELAVEVQRIREKEVAAVKLEERARYLSELDRERGKLEAVYESRLSGIRAREEKLQTEMKERERNVEAAKYEGRQRIIEELDKIRVREEELHRMEEITRKSLEFERQKWLDKNRDLELQWKELEREKRYLDDKIVKECQRLEHEWRVKMERKEQEYGELEVRYSGLQEKWNGLTNEKEDLIQRNEHQKAELMSLKEIRKEFIEKLHEREKKLAVMEEKCGYLERENGDLKLKTRDLASVQPEMEAALQQIADLRGELFGQTAQYEQSIRNLQEAASEAIAVEQENAQKWANDEVDKWKRVVSQLRMERKQLSDQLEVKTNEFDQLQAQLEDSELRCRHLQRDVEHWRTKKAEAAGMPKVESKPPARVAKSSFASRVTASQRVSQPDPILYSAPPPAVQPMPISSFDLSPIDSDNIADSALDVRHSLDSLNSAANRGRKLYERETGKKLERRQQQFAEPRYQMQSDRSAANQRMPWENREDQEDNAFQLTREMAVQSIRPRDAPTNARSAAAEPDFDIRHRTVTRETEANAVAEQERDKWAKKIEIEKRSELQQPKESQPLQVTEVQEEPQQEVKPQQQVQKASSPIVQAVQPTPAVVEEVTPVKAAEPPVQPEPVQAKPAVAAEPVAVKPVSPVKPVAAQHEAQAVPQPVAAPAPEPITKSAEPEPVASVTAVSPVQSVTPVAQSPPKSQSPAPAEVVSEASPAVAASAPQVESPVKSAEPIASPASVASPVPEVHSASHPKSPEPAAQSPGEISEDIVEDLDDSALEEERLARELAEREREEEERIRLELEAKEREEEERRKREERRLERERKRKQEEDDEKKARMEAAERERKRQEEEEEEKKRREAEEEKQKELSEEEARKQEAQEKMRKYLERARAELDAREKERTAAAAPAPAPAAVPAPAVVSRPDSGPASADRSEASNEISIEADPEFGDDEELDF